MKFITFSGVDGSGKSTQLALLKEELERENWNVAYFHAVEFSLSNRISRFFKKQKSFEPGKEKAITKASCFSLMLREIFLVIDLVRFCFLLARLKKENCDYLLSDRYFFDTIINIEFLSGKTLSSSLINYLLSCRPDISFYFDVFPENIMSRANPPEQGIEYLRTKQELFKKKIKDWNMIVIYANKDEDVIFQEILEKI